MDFYHQNTEYLPLNLGQQFFILLGLMTTAFSVPCWVIAKFIHRPWWGDNPPLDIDDEDTPYEKLYNYKDIQEAREEKELKNCILFETTPKGAVFMKYDDEEEGFLYWADKSIDYKFLETCARKFCKVYFCKDVYIYNESDTEESEEEETNEELEEKTEEKVKEVKEVKEEKNDSVFANFKNYKTNTTIQEKATEIKANKYIHKGKIIDFMIIQTSNYSSLKKKEGDKSWFSWKNKKE